MRPTSGGLCPLGSEVVLRLSKAGNTPAGSRHRYINGMTLLIPLIAEAGKWTGPRSADRSLWVEPSPGIRDFPRMPSVDAGREGREVAWLAQHLVDFRRMQLFGMDHLPREFFERDRARFDETE